MVNMFYTCLIIKIIYLSKLQLYIGKINSYSFICQSYTLLNNHTHINPRTHTLIRTLAEIYIYEYAHTYIYTLADQINAHECIIPRR